MNEFGVIAKASALATIYRTNGNQRENKLVQADENLTDRQIEQSTILENKHVNKLCKFLLAGLLIGATALSAPLTQVEAQSAPDPAIVISIANFDDQMADVDYLVEASGFAQMKFMAKTMITQYIKGIDSKSPAGIMMYFSEGSEEPDFLAFVPIKEGTGFDDLLDTISGYAEVDEGDDFTTIITDDETELLVKKVDGTAYITNKEAMFNSLPSNPVAALGELPTKYNLAAQVFGQRIPQAMRSQALDMIRDGYERQFEQLEEVEPVQAELQRKNFEFQMKQFESWINETDSLTLGMCADKDSESLYMDVSIMALANSSLAERLAASAPKEKSLFGGFLMDGAAFTTKSCMSLHPDESAEYTKMLDQVKDSAMEALDSEVDFDEEETEMFGKMLDNLIQIGKDTLAEGKLDSGAVVMVGDDGINFAGGVRSGRPQETGRHGQRIGCLCRRKNG